MMVYSLSERFGCALASICIILIYAIRRPNKHDGYIYIASIQIESCTILPSVNFYSSLHIFPYGQGGDGALKPYRTVAAQTRRSHLRLVF
jgi:hypothetical protein